MKKNITIVLVFVLAFGGLVTAGTTLSTLGFAKAFRDAASRYTSSIARVFSSSPAYADSYGYGTGGTIILPSLGTISVTDITQTTATLHGTVVDTGNDTVLARGFDYGITSTSDNTVSENGQFGIEAFSASLTGLSCGQTYSYESFARNSLGTVWYTSDETGPNASFNTAPCTVPLPSNAPWIDQIAAGTRAWQSIASSFDGSKLVAAVGGFHIFTSTDYGSSWLDQAGSGSHDWRQVVSSADGVKLAAITDSSDYIYTSTDGGVTWNAQTGSVVAGWRGIASSADGTKLAAVANSGSAYVYLSTDSGATWNPVTILGTHNWQSIASSSDGAKLAATDFGGYIFTSSDFGGTWTPSASVGTGNWTTIASSSDGTKLVTMRNGSNTLLISTDSGANWTAVTTAGSHTWRGATISDDGMKISAVANDDYIYVSADGGATWTYQTVPGHQTWHAVAASADGAKIAAVATDGDVWTKVALPTVGTNNPVTVGYTGAILSGTVTDFGNTPITAEGFEFGLSTSPYSSHTELPGNLATFSFGTTGLLTQHTTYHYRAYVVTASGTVYGEDKTFTTNFVATATTLPVTTFTATTAIFNGTGLPTPGPLWSAGFDYGLTDDYGSVVNAPAFGSSEESSFAAAVFNLECGKTYHVRAFITRGSQQEEPQVERAEGGDQQFTTSPCVTTTQSGGGSSVHNGGYGTAGFADANKDGKVDILDYVILMANWGKKEQGNLADFNQDGVVDVLDMVTLMINWSN